MGIGRALQPRQFAQGLPSRLRVAVEHADHRPFFMKACGWGGSDATGAAGDQYSLRFQPAHSRLQKIKSGRSEYLSARDRAITVRSLRQLTCHTVSSTVPSTHFTTAHGRLPNFGRAGLPQIFSTSALMPWIGRIGSFAPFTESSSSARAG